MLSVDEGFLRRVWLSSIAIAVIAGGFLMVYQSPRWGVGFLVAGLWSAYNLRALEQLVRLALRPEGRQPGAIVFALALKAPLLYGLGALIVVKGGFPVESLLIGFSIPLFVMVLKVVGMVVAPRAALPDRDVRTHDGHRHDNV